jgi:hypothetical protein
MCMLDWFSVCFFDCLCPSDFSFRFQYFTVFVSSKNSFSNYIKIPLNFLYNKISFVLVLRTFYVRGSFSKIQDGEFGVSPISTSEKVTACFCEK